MKLKKFTPNFAVKDVKRTVAFYRDRLGFKLDMVVPENSQSIEIDIP